MRKVRLRKFSLLEGQLEDDVVQWDDAVIEQSLIKGLMVNVTSQRMLNALGYKRLHKMALADCSGASLYIIENPIAAFGGCLAQDREIQGVLKVPVDTIHKVLASGLR